MEALRSSDLLVTVDAAALVAPLARRGLAVPGRGHEYNSHLAAGAGDARVLLFDRREAGLLPRRRFFHRTCALFARRRRAACRVRWANPAQG